MVSDIGYGYLIQGNLGEMFKWVFNIYFPYLLFWVFLGIVIFAIIYVKSNNLSFSTSIAMIYLIIVSNFMVTVGSQYAIIIKYISLLLILFVFFLLYKVYKS